MEQVRWKNVLILIVVLILGFFIGVFGTVAKVNKQLGYNIKVELDLFK